MYQATLEVKTHGSPEHRRTALSLPNHARISKPVAFEEMHILAGVRESFSQDRAVSLDPYAWWDCFRCSIFRVRSGHLRLPRSPRARHDFCYGRLGTGSILR